MTNLKSDSGRVFIQPGGPGYPVYLLSCQDVDDLTIPDGEIEITRCFNDAGDGWDVVGETESPPDKVTVSLTGLMFAERNWIEKLQCRASLYFMQRDCGRADLFPNYVRGEIMPWAKRSERVYSNIVMRETKDNSEMAASFESGAAYDVNRLGVARITVAETAALNDVAANPDLRCANECGKQIQPGDYVVAGADATGGGATPNYLLSADVGETFAAAAVDPLAAGENVIAVGRFYIDRDTVRLAAVKMAVGGAQGKFAYSDDNGASWTVVNIGGAVAGHGGTRGGALYHRGPNLLILASALGYVYKSTDGGESWTAVEAAAISATNYYQANFDPSGKYGIIGGVADVIILSDDSGDSWYQATATGGGGEILTCWRFDKNRILVGDDDGKLWQSFDGGDSWTQITGWTGSGTGDVMDLDFINDHQGLMVHNSAAPVGNILYTINGGRDWTVLNYVTNVGLNAVDFVTNRLAFAVGEAQGGTAVVLKLTELA